MSVAKFIYTDEKSSDLIIVETKERDLYQKCRKALRNKFKENGFDSQKLADRSIRIMIKKTRNETCLEKFAGIATQPKVKVYFESLED